MKAIQAYKEAQTSQNFMGHLRAKCSYILYEDDEVCQMVFSDDEEHDNSMLHFGPHGTFAQACNMKDSTVRMDHEKYHKPADIPPTPITQHVDPYQQGMGAYWEDVDRSDNPYDDNTEEAEYWDEGWVKASKQ